MNEPDIPFAHAPAPCATGVSGLACATETSGAAPASACYAYSAWPRYPVIGPALLVVVAVLSALLLVSNANAFNDVNAEIQIAAREQRVAREQAAERQAKAEAARRALLADAGVGAGAQRARSGPDARPDTRPAEDKRK